MRFVTSASLLIALSCFAFCASPALATPPVDPYPGSAYLDNGTQTMKMPSWLTPSARPSFYKPNLSSATLKRTDPLRASATPMPLPGPQRVSATPIPIPGPKSAAKMGGFQPKTLKSGMMSPSSRQFRLAR